MQVITDETFSHHEGFDLASFDKKKWPLSELPTFRVPKTETYNAFKARIAQHFNYPDNQIRLWVLVDRRNETVRPIAHIPEHDPTLSASCHVYTWSDFLSRNVAVDVIQNDMGTRQADLRLYLDVIPDPSKVHMLSTTLTSLTRILRSLSFLKNTS